MTTLKEQMDAQWRNPGILHSGHGNAWEMRGDYIHARAGTQRNYMDKETKRRRAKLAMYNEKLRPIILAEATKSDASYMVVNGDKLPGPIYCWPAQEATAPVVTSVPRKRVPKAKLEQAAAIIAKVPQDELTAFLARFGLSLSLAASIASLGDVEMIARQFLRATT